MGKRTTLKRTPKSQDKPFLCQQHSSIGSGVSAPGVGVSQAVSFLFPSFVLSKGKLNTTQKWHRVLTHRNPHDWPLKRHPQSGYWRGARGWRRVQGRALCQGCMVRTLGVRRMSGVRAAASDQAIKGSSVPLLLLFCFIPAGGRTPKWLLVRYPLAGLQPRISRSKFWDSKLRLRL